MSAGHRRPEGDAGRPWRVEPQDGGGELPRPLALCPPLPLPWTPSHSLHDRHSSLDRRAPCTASPTAGTCACSSATRPAGPSTRGLSPRCMGGGASPVHSLSTPPRTCSSLRRRRGLRGSRCEGTEEGQARRWQLGRARESHHSSKGRSLVVALLSPVPHGRCVGSVWDGDGTGRSKGRGWCLAHGGGLGRGTSKQDFPVGRVTSTDGGPGKEWVPRRGTCCHQLRT